MTKRQPKESMSVYEQILSGLKDGIAHARGELQLRTTTRSASGADPNRRAEP